MTVLVRFVRRSRLLGIALITDPFTTAGTEVSVLGRPVADVAVFLGVRVAHGLVVARVPSTPRERRISVGQ
jgi:hypothetical protein